MLRVCELFCSIQGEGLYTGVPSFFVRTTGCNLRCVFKDSVCDTPYSSFHAEDPLFSSEESLIEGVKDLIREYPKVNHLVITGGEPLIQKKDLEEFLKNMFKIKDNWVVTIETNGSLPMLNPLTRDFKIDLYSVSPKLRSSVDKDLKFLTEEQRDRHDKMRINYKNLYDIVRFSKNYQFKFVWSGDGCVGEIKDIYSNIAKFVDKEDDCSFDYWIRKHPNKYTMLMPEGINNEQLNNNRKDCVNKCIENGWRYCEREHIVIWGSKRGV